MILYIRKNITYLVTLFIALTSFWGALVYRVWALDMIGILISWVLTLVSFGIFCYFLSSRHRTRGFGYKIKSELTRNIYTQAGKRKIIRIYVAPIIYLLSFCAMLWVLTSFATTESIVSPWQYGVVPSYFFAIYFIATISALLVLSNDTLAIWQKRIVLYLHFAISFMVAIIVYRIGYGYDPFIHQATLEMIQKHGYVDPKPLYYLGYYAVVILTNSIGIASIANLNKVLAPLLAVMLLPSAIMEFIKCRYPQANANMMAVLMMLAIPFGIFIISTPQSLAYIFLIIAVLYGMSCDTFVKLMAVYAFAFASAVTNPIAGIPAIIFAITVNLYYSEKFRLKKLCFVLIFLIASISLPLSLYYSAGDGITVGSDQARTVALELPMPSLPGSQGVFLNFVYLLEQNLVYIIIALVIISFIYFRRKFSHDRILFISYLMSASMLISYLVSQFLNFDILIDYERNNYSERMIILAVIFLLPLIIMLFVALAEKLQSMRFPKKLIWLFFISAILCASLYISYPRFDAYHNSRGYSTGHFDLEAVDWIEKNSAGPYLVLANQQVSVAALTRFGFERNLPINEYFYPIPTGVPLYQYYLDMVYEGATREKMIEAMDYAGVDTAYFVLNKYWWAFPKVMAEAKMSADSWESFGNDEVVVFMYRR